MITTIDDIFNQCTKTDAASSVSEEVQETHSSEFLANVLLCADDQQYLDFTASNKHKHECVFDIGYAMIKDDTDTLGMLPDVREFINNFSQFCEMRLKSPVAVFTRPYQSSAIKPLQTFVYISTFIDTKHSIGKFLNILSDIRSMQQQVLRNGKCQLEENTSPKLTGHSMNITLGALLTPDGTKSTSNGRSLALDASDQFINHIYEMRYANDNFLRERSLKTADFNYTIDIVSEDLQKSGIFGDDKKPIEREVRQWFHKARLWKLEYRR